MTIQRSTPGSKLLARHEHDNPVFPFDTTDWDAVRTFGLGISVGSLQVDMNAQSGTTFIRHKGVAARSKSMVQMVGSMFAANPADENIPIAPTVHHSELVDGLDDAVRGGSTVKRSAGEFAQLTSYANGVPTTIASQIIALRAFNTSYRYGVYADGAEVVSYDFLDDVLLAGISARSSGGVGAYSTPSNFAHRILSISKFFACTDRYVTVTGIPTGGSAEVRTAADVVLGVGVASGAGVAKVDMLLVALEVATKLVVVLGGVDIDSYTVAGEIIEPGETYEIAQGFVAPTLGETIVGAYSVIFTAVPGAISHQLELSVNGGGSWVVLDDNILTAPNVDGNIVWPWNTTALGNVEGAQLRARGLFAIPTPPSDYFLSDLFDIENIPPESVPPARKAWAFTLDGHIFYVIGSFSDATLLYDGTTKQWCLWKTEGYAYWNMHRGIMWRGRVLAADRTNPVIWELDPSTQLDEEAVEITRAVTGFQPHRGDESIRQGSLRMIARQQTGAAVDAAITLRFSDDGGNTWSQPKTLLLSDAAARLEFRSLGRLRRPGRIWEITDSGGLIRISGIDSQLEGG